MVVVKEHAAQDSTLLALTDKELLGKTFEEGDLQLDFTKSFYEGEDIPFEEAEQFLNKECVVQASGEKTLAWLKTIIEYDETVVLTVQGIPTIQLILKP